MIFGHFGSFKTFSISSELWYMPLGMQDGRITRASLKASSMWNALYGPWNGRLQARNSGSTRGAWVARQRNRYQWIQVDLQTLTRLKGIATQGRYDAGQWVKTYTVSYSTNGIKFIPYREGRRLRVRIPIRRRL